MTRFALTLTLASQLLAFLPPGLVLCIEEDGAVCLETQGTLCCERFTGIGEGRGHEVNPDGIEVPSSALSSEKKCGCTDIPLVSGTQARSLAPSPVCPDIGPQALHALPPAPFASFPPPPIHVVDGEGTGPPGAALALLFVTTVVIRC